MIRYAYQSGKAVYRLNHFVVDTDAEMQELASSTKTKNSAMGSTAKVIETGEEYMLNSDKEWIKQPANSSSGSSSSSDEDDITVLNGSTDSSSTDDNNITVL